MSDGQETKAALDEDIENVAVVDPDDYAKTRKIKQIEDAKENVLNLRRQADKKLKEWGEDRVEPGVVIYYWRLGEAVADYGREVQPYISKALQKGIITEEDVTIRLKDVDGIEAEEFRLVRWITNDGDIEPLLKTWETSQPHKDDYPYPPTDICMAVFDQINQIKLDIGLGPTLEEQRTPAEI